MRSKRVILIFALGMIHLNSFAMTGAAIPISESRYPSVCKITINRSGNTIASEDLENICTGSLINETTVLTAAHCFGKSYNLSPIPVKLGCGEVSRSAIEVILPAQNQWQNELLPYSNTDYAIVKLNQAIVIKKADDKLVKRHTHNKLIVPEYIRLAKDQNIYFENDELKNGVYCQIYGFGRDPYGGEMGRLYTGSLEDIRLKVLLGARANISAGTLFGEAWDALDLNVSVDKGDSGGPLLCQAGDGPAEMIGLITGYIPGSTLSTKKQNYFTPIWSVLGL